MLHVFQPVTGGVPAYVHDLTIGLVGRGWNVTVACDPTCNVCPGLEGSGIGIAPFVATRAPSARDAVAIKQLVHAVRRERPDLIHAHSSKAGLLAGIVGRTLGVPTIYTPHGWSFQMDAPTVLRVLYAATEGLLARDVHRRIVAVCASERVEAQRWHVARGDDVVVVHTGRASGTAPPARAAARALLGLDVSDPRVIAAWIGRTGRQKGADELPVLARRLRSVGVTLATLGVGLDDAGISDAVAAAGGIAVHASTPPDALLAASDILVSTSAWEGLPLVVLEALEHGIPVVAYDVGGLREQVFEGRNGHLVPRGSIEILTDRVAEIARNPESMKRLGIASRRIWSRRFQPEMMVDRIQLVYADVLRGS